MLRLNTLLYNNGNAFDLDGKPIGHAELKGKEIIIKEKYDSEQEKENTKSVKKTDKFKGNLTSRAGRD